jgi:hypothetical protein
MAQTAPEPAPLDPYELAAGFRRLAALTNDPELAERMMRHADETEHEASAAGKKRARH